MKKIAAAAAVLMLAGCASAPKLPQPVPMTHKTPVKKASKLVEATTPNQIVKKNWFPKFKIKWLHPK